MRTLLYTYIQREYLAMDRRCASLSAYIPLGCVEAPPRFPSTKNAQCDEAEYSDSNVYARCDQEGFGSHCHVDAAAEGTSGLKAAARNGTTNYRAAAQCVGPSFDSSLQGMAVLSSCLKLRAYV